MRHLTRRSATALAAAALTLAATALPATALPAVADAATPAATACTYWWTVHDSPTPVHASDTQESTVLKWKYAGDVVTGPCENSAYNEGYYWAHVYCTCASSGIAYIAMIHLTPPD